MKKTKKKNYLGISSYTLRAEEVRDSGGRVVATPRLRGWPAGFKELNSSRSCACPSTTKHAAAELRLLEGHRRGWGSAPFSSSVGVIHDRGGCPQIPFSMKRSLTWPYSSICSRRRRGRYARIMAVVSAGERINRWPRGRRSVGGHEWWPKGNFC